MSNRKLVKAIQGFFRDLRRLHQTVTKGLVNWLLRSALKNNRGNRLANGFVLPTTVLLILVVTLTVGALTYRAYNRNAQVIGENQQRIIYNAATPAIDRARSKLEFLFDATKDNRYPGGVPSEGRLLSMLLNDGRDSAGVTYARVTAKDKDGNPILAPNDDPYKLPDEERVDLNGDGRNDNAWSFRTDTNGDNTADATVIYSVIFKTPTDAVKNPQELLLTTSDSNKAKQLLVRHGPLSKESTAVKCGSGSAGAEDGWFEERGNTSILRKNFQVDAMVIPDAANSTVATLEFHQDRQLNRGNKWGAWFRNDLEISPGPPFNWNGAMHTEGSLMLGGDQFKAHLISAPKSCLYSPADNSEITVTKKDGFTGTVIAGKIAANNGDKAPSAQIYIYGATPTAKTLESGTDSTASGFGPYDVSIDPRDILVKDGYSYRPDKATGDAANWTNLKNPGLAERISSKSQDKPYVDDLYRADDRWGPKPKYGTGDTDRVVKPGDMGKPIPKNSDTEILTQDDSGVGSTGSGVGLDGYWERRARFNGLRILVGERLELGNLNTWVTPRDTNNDKYITYLPALPALPAATLTNPGPIDPSDEREGDPLYPPTIAPYPTATRADRLKHLDLQRRTLRDNLSAVQTTAVYHAAVNKDYPVACLASTAHPGTLSTLYQSINFQQTGGFKTFDQAGVLQNPLQSNFFTGKGTNGWEFSAPGGSATAFAFAMGSSTSPLRTALQNLANFAGDPDGVFPLPPTNAAVTHPYPALSMWGNFSNLRRVLAKLDAPGGYAGLSIADKTYLQTASCTIGVLAYNIDEIQKFDPTNVKTDYSLGNGTTVLEVLAEALLPLMDGFEGNGEVLPQGQLASRKYDPNDPTTATAGSNKDVDYRDIPPEAWIGALKQQILKSNSKLSSDYQTALTETLNDPRVKMAELIMLKYQIRRDRSYGFRSSPAFGSYVAQAPGGNKFILPSACDPDDFKFTSLLNDPGKTGPATAKGVTEGRYRLALSRLCGALDNTNYNPDKYKVGEKERAWVLPKFPALYYIFPETEHDLDGALVAATAGTAIYDHRQPGSVLKTAFTAAVATDVIKGDSRAENDLEPYVEDSYVAGVNGSVAFKVVPGGALPLPETTFPYSPGSPTLTPTAAAASATSVDSRYPYEGTTPSPVKDSSLSAIALTPRPLASWQLPRTASTPLPGNVPSNIIVSTDGTKVAVPFLDRALFDGRQLMLMRSLDIDLGMLRSNKPIGTTDVWLPESGIVYAFREDAIREDAITRPVGTATDLRNPATPTDPPFVDPGTTSRVSPKAVDYIPDPERRVHGFRLRNGAEVKRKDSLLAPAKNIRGLSFFTDQPVFIQGDFNLHQKGAENTSGTRLEEFTQTLPDNDTYSDDQFYKNRTTPNYEEFSSPTVDRWRPSEILADSIGILSNEFCDGSIADTFVDPNFTHSDHPVADFDLTSSDDPNREKSRAQYNNTDVLGLFGPGCTGKGYTSFH
ncbi:MAG: hormogonium polysaccharide biosynthesis protein HpsA, partial [Phormidesmis sp. CAN_BIN36]|nr:hormogonium polysaccharide biosynthesis protein HpsA [Phormidesmis sp. CAN_BIN36]